MQDRESELPRTPILRSWVNKLLSCVIRHNDDHAAQGLGKGLDNSCSTCACADSCRSLWYLVWLGLKDTVLRATRMASICELLLHRAFIVDAYTTEGYGRTAADFIQGASACVIGA
jgi:hypothetical protein